MKESQLQTTVEHYLSILESQGKLVYIKNNSGAFKTASGGFYRVGKAGSSDFLVFVKGGKCLHLEIKVEKGRQSNLQKEYEDKVTAIGHKYFLARSIDEVTEMLSRFV